MKLKPTLRKGLDTFGRFKMYFLRGHNSWFYFVFWFASFATVIYKLLLEDLSLPEWMSFTYFVLLFLLIYIPLATTFGMFDYRKGTFRGEALLSLEVNPVTQKMFNELKLILDKQKELEEQLKTLQESLEE